MFLSSSKTAPVNTQPNATETTQANNDAQSVLDAFGQAQAIIEFTPEGEILTANSNFLAVLGYSLGEIQGKHHRIFVEPTEAAGAEYTAFWRDLAAGHLAKGE